MHGLDLCSLKTAMAMMAGSRGVFHLLLTMGAYGKVDDLTRDKFLNVNPTKTSAESNEY
jgi:hypothetical protein